MHTASVKPEGPMSNLAVALRGIRSPACIATVPKTAGQVRDALGKSILVPCPALLLGWNLPAGLSQMGRNPLGPLLQREVGEGEPAP